MARTIPALSGIYGILGSWRDHKPYNDLNEVLNKIGVMAKRYEIPYARVIIAPTKLKQYYWEDIEYYIPKNWRDCLYEDLETGDYYIVNPDPQNIENSDIYSWIAFKLTGLCDAIKHFSKDDSGMLKREILYNTGTFIDLIKRCGLNESLDTLAKTEKPIIVKVKQRLYGGYNNDYIGAICQFDI